MLISRELSSLNFLDLCGTTVFGSTGRVARFVDSTPSCVIIFDLVQASLLITY